MKAEKLLKMIYLLLEHRQLTAPALADRLEVSVRTIYRYVDTLSTAGFPVYATKGRNGGIALLPEFKLNSTVVDSQEQVNILAALKTLRTLHVDDGMALDKLTAIFNRTPVAWLQVDPTGWGPKPGQRALLGKLREAILRQHFVRFNYLNSRNQQAERYVFPWRVLFKDHAWYLEGYAVERRAARLFKLTRLTALQPAATPADPQQPWLQTTASEQDHPAKVRVKLKFASELKYRIFETFGPEEVTRQPDGSFLVSSEFNDSAWLTTYLLSFGAGLEVLAPTRIRERVRTELQKTLANY